MIESFKRDGFYEPAFHLKDGSTIYMNYLGAPYPMSLSDCRLIVLENMTDNHIIYKIAGRDFKIGTVI